MYLRLPKRFVGMLGLLAIAALACGLPGASTGSSAAPTEPIIAAGSTSSPAAPRQAGVAPVGLPDKRADQAGDVNSSVDARKKMVPGGDEFVNGLYERPFNANTMDTYFPYLDIVDAQAYVDDTWGYATITMDGTDANEKLPGKYGVELDLNKDGRGEWLILASNPASTDWTTQGVQAWKDDNSDIGGDVPLVADKNPTGGNGYEKLVFDQGQGSNVDGAWVRVSASDPNTITLAFKLEMLGGPKSFALGAWAGSADSLNPAKFDFNDQMTHAEAGSPLPTFKVYPLKALSEVDNTCRLAVGFAPTGKEPGLCATVAKRQGESASCQPCRPGITAVVSCSPCP
jgi:hypothetical protein